MFIIAIVWIAVRPLVGGLLMFCFFVVMCGFVCFKFYSKGTKVAAEDSAGLAQGEVVGQEQAVAPETAQGFVQSLRAEYLENNEGAVGQFFDRLPQEEQDKLGKFEEEVQAASDKQQ